MLRRICGLEPTDLCNVGVSMTEGIDSNACAEIQEFPSFRVPYPAPVTMGQH